MTSSALANRSMSSLEWAMLVSLSVLWGGSFLFVGIAVKELPPLTIVACRVVVAAAVLLAAARAIRVPIPAARPVWRLLFALGILNNALPFVLITWAQQHVASGTASILNATAPIFGVVVAHRFTKDDRLNAGRVGGVVLGFAGVATLFGYSALQSFETATLAQLAVLVAAMCYAFAAVLSRRLRGLGVAPLAVATGQFMASTLMLLPVALMVDRPWTLPAPSNAAVAALACLALFSTALAYVLYFRLLATAGATNSLLVTFLIPVSAILLGAWVLHETLEPRQIAGMAFIALGLAAIDGRPWRALRRSPRSNASSPAVNKSPRT